MLKVVGAYSEIKSENDVYCIRKKKHILADS